MSTRRDKQAHTHTHTHIYTPLLCVVCHRANTAAKGMEKSRLNLTSPRQLGRPRTARVKVVTDTVESEKERPILLCL